jgi:ankyrin repeat protein
MTPPVPEEPINNGSNVEEATATDNCALIAPQNYNQFDDAGLTLGTGLDDFMILPLFNVQVPGVPFFTDPQHGNHWLQDPKFIDPSLPNPTIEWMKKIGPYAFPTSAPLVQALMLSGNGANFGTALVCPPAVHQALCKESLGARLVHFIVAGLVNNLIKLENLKNPENQADILHQSGLRHLHSLPPSLLVPLLDSVPTIYSQALRNRLFHAAIELNAYRVIPTLIQRGADPNSDYLVGHVKYYPLDRACYLGHAPCVRVLLQGGADPNLEGCTPFSWLLGELDPHDDDYMASFADDKVEIIGMLLREHADIDHESPTRRFSGSRYRSSSGYSTVKLSDPRVIQCIIANAEKDNLGVIVSQGYLAVMLLSHDVEVAFRLLKMVLSRCCNPEVRRSEHFSMVMHACLVNAAIPHNNEAIDLLLAIGAQPSVLCLRRAVTARNVEAVIKFIDFGVDANAPSDLRTQPPWLGQGEDSLLISEPSTVHYYNATPFSDAIRCQFHEILQIFVERGFLSAITKDPDGLRSTLIAASGAGNHTIVDIVLDLQDFVVDNRAFGFMFSPALTESARNGHWGLVDKLISAGIEPNLEALTHAIVSKSLRHVQLFFDALPQTSTPEDLLNAIIKAEDITILDNFLSGYGDPDIVFPLDENIERKMTLLSAAILSRNSAYVDYLLQAGAGLNVPGTSVTPLSAAVEVVDHNLVELFLGRGADPWDNVALLAATEAQEYTMLKTLLGAFRLRYPLTQRNYGGRAILKAVELGNLRLLRVLAEIVDLNCTCGDSDDDRFYDYRSSLDAAIQVEKPLGQKLEIMRVLLEKGADPNDVYKGRSVYSIKTPLLRAIEQREIPIIQELVRWGANIGLPAKRGLRRTPLQQACELGFEEIVAYLLQQGVDPNEGPAISGGATAIQLAAIKGWVGIADTLFRAGADINAAPALFHGRTAFEGAAEHGRIDMMLYLVDHGVDLLSDGAKQYHRAVRFAKKNSQVAARELAEKLHREAESQASAFAACLGIGDVAGSAGLGGGLEGFVDVGEGFSGALDV